MLNMSPVSTLHNTSNRGAGHFVFGGKLSNRERLTCVAVANVQHARIGQFGGRIPDARTVLDSTVATLGVAIGGVIPARAKKEMIRIAARWIVATMTNTHPAGDRPEGQRIRNAMSTDLRSTNRATAHVDLESPVPVVIQRSGKKPTTIIGSVNFRPKPRNVLCGKLVTHNSDSLHESGCAVPRAVTAAPGFSMSILLYRQGLMPWQSGIA